MPRISGIDAITEAMERSGSSGNSFFSLKNHADQAKVRLLFEDLNDADTYFLHKVMVGGKQRWVDCLNSDDKNPKPCALCEAGNKIEMRMILTLYDHADKSIKIWDRGKEMIRIINGIYSTYGAPLYNRDFLIIRNGKPGDQKTTYTVNGLDRDQDPAITEMYKKMTEERDPVSAPDGAYILEKTYDEMKALIAQGANDVVDNFAVSVQSSNTQQSQSPAGDSPPKRGKMF